jgi:hypothetical protein
MPETRIGKLSDASLDYIYDRFLLGFNAFNILEGSATHQLIKIAQGNIAAAVNYLRHQKPQYGESKWASLQAAEKLLKAAIELAGGHYAHGHDLTVLGRQAQQFGLRGDLGAFFAELQCTPGIRYGEVPCDRNQAIAAHHASLALIISLYKAGAEFQMKLRPANAAD